MSDGFTILVPSIGVIVGYGLAFYCLSICLNTLPLSLAYAIWSGVGTALTAVIGALVWDEVFTALKLAGIVLIIGGVILLNTSEKKKWKKSESQSALIKAHFLI